MQDQPRNALGDFPHMLYENPKGAGRDYVAGQTRGGGWDRRGKGRHKGWKGSGRASSAVGEMSSRPK